MGGTRARVSTSARDNGASKQETEQEQRSDQSSAAVEADKAAANKVGGKVSADALRGMDSALRRKALSGLSAIERAPLINAFAADPEALDDLFAATPDKEAPLLRAILEVRFNKRLNNEDKTEWDAGGLRRMYATFSALPVEHVANNDKFDNVTKYGDSDKRYIHGYYDPMGQDSKDDVIAFSYDSTQLSAGVHGEYVEKTDGLLGANEFDSCVRHEVGHAVDEKLRVMDTHMSEAAFGGWRRYSSAQDWAAEMYDNAPLEGAAGQRDLIISVLGDAIDQDPSTDANGAVDPNAVAKRFVSAVSKRLVANAAVSNLADEVQQPIIAHIGRVLTGAKPWNGHDGGGAVNGRVYEESYKGQYMSYDASARDPAKRCSLYQFRAPGEFFAESYSLYYTPVKSGEVRGKLLADRNKPLFDWFAQNFEKPGTPTPSAPPATDSTASQTPGRR